MTWRRLKSRCVSVGPLRALPHPSQRVSRAPHSPSSLPADIRLGVDVSGRNEGPGEHLHGVGELHVEGQGQGPESYCQRRAPLFAVVGDVAGVAKGRCQGTEAAGRNTGYRETTGETRSKRGSRRRSRSSNSISISISATIVIAYRTPTHTHSPLSFVCV